MEAREVRMKSRKDELDLKYKGKNIQENKIPDEIVSNSTLPSKNFESTINYASSKFSADLKNSNVALHTNTTDLTKVCENSQNPSITLNPFTTAISSNFGESILADQPSNNQDSSEKHLGVTHLNSTPEPSSSFQPYDVDEFSASFDSKHITRNESKDNEVSVLIVGSSLSSNLSSSNAFQSVDSCSKESTNILTCKVASSCVNSHIVPSTTRVCYNMEDLESEDDWPDFPHSPPSPSYTSPPTTAKMCTTCITKNIKSMESFISDILKTTVSSSTSMENREGNADNTQVGFNNSFLPFSFPREKSCITDASIDGVKPSCSFVTPPSNILENSFRDIIVPNHISNSSSHSKNTVQNDEHDLFSPSELSGNKSLPSCSRIFVRTENDSQTSGCSSHHSKGKYKDYKVNGNLFDVQAVSSNDKTPSYWLFTGSTSTCGSQETLEDVAAISRRARALVAEGVNPRRRDESGATPAHIAAKKGCAATLSALLYLGADPDAKDLLGWRPLHYASRYNHSMCVALLVARGAHVEARNAAGKSPLHVAAASCAREATRALLVAGANNKARDESGTTPLDVAHSIAVRRERLVGRLSGRFLSKKGFGHWTNWRHLLEKERKIRDMLNNVHGEW